MPIPKNTHGHPNATPNVAPSAKRCNFQCYLQCSPEHPLELHPSGEFPSHCSQPILPMPIKTRK